MTPSATIADEIDINNSAIEQAKSDAELLEHPEVENGDLKAAKEDAEQLETLPQVESASIKTNHHGIQVEVTPTDAVAGRSLNNDLRQNNFAAYNSFINIKGI